MSDRIDELVLDGCAFVACPRPQDCDTCPLTELATIARGAEAMCELLAEEVAMGRHDTVDNVLDAVREAVSK